jgi:probable HAF family extracellular repeat protein
MKSKTLTCITATILFAALAIPVRLAAQDKRYKLIDLGTLGGTNSGIFFESSPQNVLSNQGIVAACADTSIGNPDYPNFNPVPGLLSGVPGGPLPDPFTFHTLRWENGKSTDLGALPGVNSSCPAHISHNGLIVGASSNGAIDPITGWPEEQAVLWKDGQVISLGNLGGYESYPSAVNNRGQVVGQATNGIPDPFDVFGFGQQSRAFLSENGVMQDLGTLGGPDALGVDINDRGQVLGISFINSIPNPTTGFPTADAFLWENGKMTDIPDPLGGTGVNAFYLSAKGQVLGRANLPGDIGEQGHPFLWEKGVFTDLGTFGGTSGSAVEINAAGQIIGTANYPGDIKFRAFLWAHGTKSDLGVVSGNDCSTAYAINSRGQVVGWSASFTSHDCAIFGNLTAIEAFVWERRSGMLDLNTLVPANSGIFLFIATDINDRGEIAAEGTLANGDVRAVLLIPCGENEEGCVDDAKSVTTAGHGGSTLTMAQRLAIRRMMARSRTRFAQRYHIPGLWTPKD